jgi:putative phosphoribosyl transferase
LTLPEPVTGVVVFAHGSGPSRHSPRNRSVAEVLQRAGPSALLLDLLGPDEELNRANVFDIAQLPSRLAHVEAPTLLTVGSTDELVLELIWRAQARLHCPNHLAVVAGATHLFEEPGTLAEAAVLATDRFTHYLVPTDSEQASRA